MFLGEATTRTSNIAAKHPASEATARCSIWPGSAGAKFIFVRASGCRPERKEALRGRNRREGSKRLHRRKWKAPGGSGESADSGVGLQRLQECLRVLLFFGRTHVWAYPVKVLIWGVAPWPHTTKMAESKGSYSPGGRCHSSISQLLEMFRWFSHLYISLLPSLRM